MDWNVNRMKQKEILLVYQQELEAIVKLVSNMAACILDLEFCSKKLQKQSQTTFNGWIHETKSLRKQSDCKTNGSQDIMKYIAPWGTPNHVVRHSPGACSRCQTNFAKKRQVFSFRLFPLR